MLSVLEEVLAGHDDVIALDIASAMAECTEHHGWSLPKIQDKFFFFGSLLIDSCPKGLIHNDFACLDPSPTSRAFGT